MNLTSIDMMGIGELMGIRLFESPHLTEKYQFRFPHSKRRRIRKKWAKRKENWKERPSTKVLMTAQGIFCHPNMARSLREALQERR